MDGQPSRFRGQSNDLVRRQNLSTMLRLVHHAGVPGLSRSDLTTLTGLNRSTVGALAAELSLLGLVEGSEPRTPTRVGRPSAVVSTTDRVVAIAVNPEIDAIAVALVALGSRVLARRRIPAPRGRAAADMIPLIVGAVAEWRHLVGGRRVAGVGVAVPGLVRDDGVVRVAPHLGWVDEPFAEELSVALGLPVRAANDATLGVLAESTFGVGRGVEDLVYLNGGASGIGGGVVVGGFPLTGAGGFAGEFGHTLVVSEGSRCHCGATGCLETEVRRERLLAATGLDEGRSDELASVLAASADPVVRLEIERQLDHLALALRNAVNVFDPARIVLGGFLAALDAAAPGELGRRLDRDSFGTVRPTVPIVRAALGSDILAVGAAELVFAGVLADPASFEVAREG